MGERSPAPAVSTRQAMPSSRARRMSQRAVERARSKSSLPAADIVEREADGHVSAAEQELDYALLLRGEVGEAVDVHDPAPGEIAPLKALGGEVEAAAGVEPLAAHGRGEGLREQREVAQLVAEDAGGPAPPPP